mmetsp:Transcript_2516/g.3700  ORF Transcript_2516/g.3700 Transcript_2516/m.3700 type:complete len:411 (+) Transcript_2516:393-1625(+)
MEKRNKLIAGRDAALNNRKKLSTEIGKLLSKKLNEEADKAKEEVTKFKAEADKSNNEIDALDKDINDLFMRLPNLLDSRVKQGEDEKSNELICEWGAEYVKKGEDFLWHDDIADLLKGWDPVGSAKISGSRFSVLKGSVAKLERALSQFFMDVHTNKHGYEETSVPLIISQSALEGTGQLPKFEEDLFKTNHQVGGENSYLLPTAEVPLTNLYRETILEEKDLPISMVALTPCFRAEAGSYGRDTKGLLRQHQFYKVELVKITTPQASMEQHEILTSHAETVLKLLKLPYRKMRLCSGDTGFSARMCYDLEVWLPGQNSYREISSCSNCGDFQAQRMGLRYRTSLKSEDSKKTKATIMPCHTINGSGIAVGRALIAVLENYFDPIEKYLEIPEALVPYMGGINKLHCISK